MNMLTFIISGCACFMCLAVAFYVFSKRKPTGTEDDPTGQKESDKKVDGKYMEPAKAILAIAAMLAVLNYLLARFEFNWWWVLWDHGPFYIANFAILIGCYAVKAGKDGTVKILGWAALSMVFIGWIAVINRHPDYQRPGTASAVTQTPVDPAMSIAPLRPNGELVPKGTVKAVPRSRFVSVDMDADVQIRKDEGPWEPFVDRMPVNRRVQTFEFKSDKKDFYVTVLVPES